MEEPKSKAKRGASQTKTSNMSQMPRIPFDKLPSDGGYGGVRVSGKRITFTATAELLNEVQKCTTSHRKWGLKVHHLMS